MLGARGWHSVENLWDGGLKVPASRVVAIVQSETLRDLLGRSMRFSSAEYDGRDNPGAPEPN